ncbi:hypothetical protein ABZZ79_27800 [Streptomyces sp. NPDC006458]|uniref:hypothetical protein n=1 Tax=Streptomyces sp. NPDC006458 TaxID=3154302 RepID=UPI0033AE5E17
MAQPSLGGDELRARAYLRALRARPLGHQDTDMTESTHTPLPRPRTGRLPDWRRPKPTTLPAPDDSHSSPAANWWDALYGDDDAETAKAPAPDTEDPEPEPTGGGWWTPQPGYYPQPYVPAFITEAPSRVPLSPKTRSALYNASAAGAGWALGLYDQAATALADCGSNYSIGGALVLGVGGCLLIAHAWDRRTRHWWPGLAWAARIPLATTILALALWAPAA